MKFFKWQSRPYSNIAKSINNDILTIICNVEKLLGSRRPDAHITKRINNDILTIICNVEKMLGPRRPDADIAVCIYDHLRVAVAQEVDDVARAFLVDGEGGHAVIGCGDIEAGARRVATAV
jgi:hypothetical protein